MTESWISKQQPATYDYLRPNGFKLIIDGLPNVNYACQSVVVPSVSTGRAIRSTPFVDIPNVGDKLVFGDFQVQFLLQEEMQNYLELFQWIQAIGFPRNYSQHSRIASISKNKNSINENLLEMSDATLIIFSSANNPKLAIKFYDLFPTELNMIEFDIRTTDVAPCVATASFAYREFEFITTT